MRNLIVSVFLIVFIISINIFINQYIKKSYDDFNELGSQYIHDIEEENWTDAKKSLEKMQKQWEETEHYLKLVVNHETVESIGANFKISEIYLKKREGAFAAAQCEELLHFLEHLHENEQINRDNIF
jgi:hypothetical protein